MLLQMIARVTRVRDVGTNYWKGYDREYVMLLQQDLRTHWLLQVNIKSSVLDFRIIIYILRCIKYNMITFHFNNILLFIILILDVTL